MTFVTASHWWNRGNRSVADFDVLPVIGSVVDSCLTYMNRPRMFSRLSRCSTRSHRYADGDPSGLSGLPAPPSSVPRLNGRKCVFSPASLVVIQTSSLETAKCTSARAPDTNSGCDLPGAGVLRLPAGLVLVDRVLNGLREVGLQLERGDREAVDEEHKVDGALVGGGEVHLPHHPHPDGGVVGVALLVQRRLGLELAHLELRGQVREPLAQQVQRAAAVLQRRVEHLHDPVKQLALLLGDVAGAGLDDLLQLLGLRFGQPAEDVLGEQGALAVVASVSRGVEPAVARRGARRSPSRTRSRCAAPSQATSPARRRERRSARSPPR